MYGRGERTGGRAGGLNGNFIPTIITISIIDGGVPPPMSIRIQTQGNTVTITWYPSVPVVSMTNVTINIPTINYTNTISATPTMTLNYSFSLPFGRAVSASIFASNEYGEGQSSFASARTPGT